jgi:hypothetical protein
VRDKNRPLIEGRHINKPWSVTALREKGYHMLYGKAYDYCKRDYAAEQEWKDYLADMGILDDDEARKEREEI